MKKRRNIKNKWSKVSPKPKTGLVWYTPNQWARMREIASDPEGLENTYGEWLEAASKAFKKLSRLGRDVVKIIVDADEFMHWCKLKGKKLNSASRSEFVARKLRNSNKKSS